MTQTCTDLRAVRTHKPIWLAPLVTLAVGSPLALATGVLGHREAAKPRGRKTDPNFDMAAFRAALGRAPVTAPSSPAPKDDLMILDKTFLAKGRNDFRLIVPIGSASAPWGLREAVISVVGNGPVTGMLYVQSDKAGIVDVPVKITNTNGISQRLVKALPSGTTQVGVVLDAPGGGTVVVEGAEK